MDRPKPLIVGNWKMHGTLASARALAMAVAAQASAARVVVCPPATLLREVGQVIAGTGVRLGAQDCHAEAEGAFTGDISAAMLKEAGCAYVIVGHSERRAGHGETDAMVSKKAAAAIAAGLIPIICVGETWPEREAGRAETVVEAQVKACLPPQAAKGGFVLAYEPVWAIGTGKTPAVPNIAAMHAHIQATASGATGLAKSSISVLYGGSLKAANAKEILSIEGVGGALVGGASLKVEEFGAIIEAAA